MLGLPEPIARYGFHLTTFAYQDGIPHLQGEGVGKGPVVARGAGHMIHMDAPELVAREVLELVQGVGEGKREKAGSRL
jgi:pimeloyl-ACP methyl ester carboxylesterase